MKIPVAFDPNNLNSGKGVRRGTISVVTNNTPDQNLEVTWYTSLDSGDNLILTNDSLTLDKQPDPGLATPLFWPTARDSASFLETINGLPRSPKNITDMGTAWEYLASKEYFILDPNNPLPNIVTDGLVLDIEANQPTSYPTTGSTAYDLSGYGNDASLINGPTFNSSGYLTFDGIDDSCTFPSSTFNAGSPQEGTFSMLVKFPTLYTVSNTIMFYDGGTTNNLIYFYRNGFWAADTYAWLIYYTKNDTSVAAILPATYYSPGNWYDITFTFNNIGQYRAYKNGVLFNSTNATDFLSWNRTGTNNPYFDPSSGAGTGSIQSFKWYNKALSESEVKQNYYGGPIVTDGLVLAMDASNLVSYESGSTTAYSLTGSIYSGSLTNGVSFSNSNGGVWDFDGSDDYISIPTYTFGNGNWTLSMWINADDFSNYNLMSNSSGGPVANAFGAYNSKIYYQNYDGAWKPHYGNTTLSTGEWYMLTWVNYQGALTSDGTMQMYVNGRLDSSLFNSYTTNGGPCNVIGKRWGGTPFNGKIGNVYIQTKSLSDEEVAQNFNAQKSRFGI